MQNEKECGSGYREKTGERFPITRAIVPSVLTAIAVAWLLWLNFTTVENSKDIAINQAFISKMTEGMTDLKEGQAIMLQDIKILIRESRK